MEQLELDLGLTEIPDTLKFVFTVTDEATGQPDTTALGYEEVVTIRAQMGEWLAFVEGRAHGR